ncbi:MAG: deoxyribose-phosphate aldolase [Candidatus Paceibacterota bacterium]|jgi:deoxyribose-phosphate aldolase|nr:deoxyribose-phosphate aldolase [Candidatus Paceibacterota bacterium]MDD4831069.1 deoxyribose-phosphate aldolase [Candidatus Paceibacterota bacterium]MDD4875466.1 deoxyribose-phosphate aldolase [Candidatus Paceibacterota bacterium]
MEILNKIDHTNIKEEASKEDIIRTCQEAKKYGFRGVCVRTKWVKTAQKELAGSGIKVVCLIDSPIGDSSHAKRLEMVKKAIKDGADDIDIVMSLPDAKHGKWGNILKDLKPVCKLKDTKVIIGSGYLTDDEVVQASKVVKEAGAICVKTATEKDPLENSELAEKAKHLKLMRQAAPGLLIKASGNVKSLADAQMMVEMGADIIGTSSGATIAKILK